MHVNPRLPQNYIVRNTKTGGSWQQEEVTSAQPFTLKRGHPFGIQIHVTESDYLISVNGLHYTLYKHRVPYQRVTTLQVVGGVSDVQMQQTPVEIYPDRTVIGQTDSVPIIDSIAKVNIGREYDLVNKRKSEILLNEFSIFSKVYYSIDIVHFILDYALLWNFGRIIFTRKSNTYIWSCQSIAAFILCKLTTRTTYLAPSDYCVPFESTFCQYWRQTYDCEKFLA